MAASLVNDVNMEQNPSQLREKVYEKIWTIPNWDRIQRRKELVLSQTLDFETGSLTGVQTRWKACFKFGVDPETKFYFCFELIETKGDSQDQKVTASANCWILKEGSQIDLMEFPKGEVKVGQVIIAPIGTLCFNSERWTTESWINSSGEVAYKLKLVIMEPEVDSAGLKTELFHKASFEQVRSNFASLLGDQSSADLKIITSDEKELFAHKIILKVQCPVFESMFRSDLSENQTGVVSVKDVNGKTMGIFLHLFYTGELLPSWKDDDTVVGFTYACGKYQLGNVLKFLDGILGDRDEEDSFQRDVQLVDLARKLNLKNAEKGLLGRIKKTMNKVNSGDELFDLYAW